MKGASLRETLPARLYAEGTLFALDRSLRSGISEEAKPSRQVPWQVTFEYGCGEHVEGVSRKLPSAGAGVSPPVAIKLRFASARAQTAFFERGYGFFLPLGRWWRLECWYRFFRALHQLGKTMKPASSGRVEGERAVRCRVTLLMGFIGRALEVLVREDPMARRTARATPRGEIWFEGPEATVLLGLRIDGSGLLTLIEEPEEGEDVRRAWLRFRDWRGADTILRGITDPQEEVNRGVLVVSGYVPLADRVGLLLDRLNRFVRAA